MAKRPKRQKAIKRLNLSDHTLDINIRRCNYNKFSFSDIEEYVHELVGSRDYEYDAIKQIMIYLWGGSYKSITELGRENYKQKLQIQQRFGTEENFLRQLPLPERLLGVVHMATGTGKSYVIFATAWLSLFKPEDFVERRDEIIRTFVKGDTRPPYVVNTSKLKSPQNIILVSHSPEKEFIFQLIDNSDYIDSWIKSPDKNFYSIDYEYWKGGKDRVKRSFNPDFFIKIDLDDYISILDGEGHLDHLEKLKKLQDNGIETLIKVVEIKSDEERDEATPAKKEYAKAHFERVNRKLGALNTADLESRYQPDAKQYYTFDLLTPNQFPGWIANLKPFGVP